MSDSHPRYHCATGESNVEFRVSRPLWTGDNAKAQFRSYRTSG